MFTRLTVILSLAACCFAEAGVPRLPEPPQKPVYYFDPCIALVDRPHPCDVLSGYSGGTLRLPTDPDRGFAEMNITVDRLLQVQKEVLEAAILNAR